MPNENNTLPIKFNMVSKTSGLYTLSKLSLSSNLKDSTFLELYPMFYNDSLSQEPVPVFPRVNIFDTKFYTVSKNPKTIPLTTVALSLPMTNVKLFLEVIKVTKLNKEDI